jgi:hypothetical protein
MFTSQIFYQRYVDMKATELTVRAEERYLSVE